MTARPQLLDRAPRIKGAPIALEGRLIHPVDAVQPTEALGPSHSILLSIVLFTAAFPIILAGRPAPRRAIRMIPFLTVIAAFLWAYACRVWYPQLVTVE